MSTIHFFGCGVVIALKRMLSDVMWGGLKRMRCGVVDVRFNTEKVSKSFDVWWFKQA
jgi:hypothetical protein